MNILYYHPICAKSRLARIILNESKINYTLKVEDFWLFRENFVKLNPAQELPILIHNQFPIIGINPIIEYLSDISDKDYFYGTNYVQKAETRRMIDWSLNKLYPEVIEIIITQKLLAFYNLNTNIDSNMLRHAKTNLKFHLDYFKFLITKNGFIAGNHQTIADFAIASFISFLDYLNEIDWYKYFEVKHWYAVIKSRPSFKFALEENFKGYSPAPQYKLLDF